MTETVYFIPLLEAAKKLRAAQISYLKDPPGERDNTKGMLVGIAASELDRVIEQIESEYE